jgi:hypothetical protein
MVYTRWYRFSHKNFLLLNRCHNLYEHRWIVTGSYRIQLALEPSSAPGHMVIGMPPWTKCIIEIDRSRDIEIVAPIDIDIDIFAATGDSILESLVLGGFDLGVLIRESFIRESFVLGGIDALMEVNLHSGGRFRANESDSQSSGRRRRRWWERCSRLFPSGFCHIFRRLLTI